MMTTMSKISILSMLPLLFLSSVSAHGYVSKVTIGGTAFKGSPPNSEARDGVVRVVQPDQGPVKGATNPDINCGLSAVAVTGLAKGQPGDTMEFTWANVASETGNWIHDRGPIQTYMAECTNGDCTTFDTTDAAWFKIDEQGFDESTGAWVQATVMNGAPAKVTLPSTLAAGKYMVRHEIIALHVANSIGGAEFYPSCTQLTVGGSETGTAKKSEEVAFPGAYNDTDPGIKVDAYSTEGTVDYVFPGPDIAAFVKSSSSSSSGGSSSSSSTPSASASGSESDSSPSSTASSSSAGPTSDSVVATVSGTGSGSCKTKKMKKRAAEVARKRSIRLSRKPTHYSRVFRGVDLSV